MPHVLATHVANLSGPLAGKPGQILFGIALLVLVLIGLATITRVWE